MIKLSEAIREGAKLRPQGFGALFGRMTPGEDFIPANMPKCACALGSAYDYLAAQHRAKDIAVLAKELGQVGNQLAEDYEVDDPADYVYDESESIITDALRGAWPILEDNVKPPATLNTDEMEQLKSSNYFHLNDDGTIMMEPVITFLNDHLQWTRNQIANWLESIGY